MAKGKPSKKEKERKKREEEERKQRELDQKEEDVKSKEKQKQTDTDVETRRIEVAKLQLSQRESTIVIIDHAKVEVDKLRKQRWETEMWNRYMSCDGKPDVEDPKQLNAFISKWLENQAVDPNAILKQADEAFELLDKLETTLFEARHLSDRILKPCEQVIIDLIHSIQLKLDETAYAVLRETCFSTDSETGNSLFYNQNESVKFAVWSNLACNPRYNGLMVNELQVQFVIPRSVVSLECAVRLMKMSRDLYSRFCPVFTATKIPIFSEKIELTEVQAKKAFSGFSQSDSWDEGGVDIRDYCVVGQLLAFDLVVIPPQPLKVKRWIMRRVEDTQQLRYIPWVSEYSPGASNGAADDAKKDEEEAENEKMKAMEELKSLIRISWKLPDEILWNDIPKLVRWDTRNQVWTSSGLYEVAYKEDQPSLSFNSAYFGTFAVLLPRFAAFPYQAWELAPKMDGNSATFTITTMVAAIEIAVNDIGSCSLIQIQSNEKLYCESCYGQWFTPTRLLQVIQSIGIFITPNNQDHMFSGHIKAKNVDLEYGIYRHISRTSSAIGFSYSRWNTNIGAEKCVLRVLDPAQAEAGKMAQNVIMVTGEHVTLLKCTEVSQTFSETPSEKDPESADIYHFVLTIADKEIKTALGNPNYAYVDAIYQVLSATRVLCC